MVVGPRAAAGARCQRRAASNANRSELRWGEGWRRGGALARSLARFPPPSCRCCTGSPRLTPPACFARPSPLVLPPLMTLARSYFYPAGIKKRNTGLNFYTNTVAPCITMQRQTATASLGEGRGDIPHCLDVLSTPAFHLPRFFPPVMT